MARDQGRSPCEGAIRPGYLALAESGELEARGEKLLSLLGECRLCPRDCGVNRLAGELGFCRVGKRPVISSYGPHFGEEAVLTGTRGSGTIFFTHCNMGCVFCQNYDISHGSEGSEVEARDLARAMLSLQRMGCHNINLVTPTHQVPQIVEALKLAAAQGLCLPLVYNCGGYEKTDTLRLLDGIVDIYMPDFKYWDESAAIRFSRAPGYPELARSAIREMHRQVGDLIADERGIAVRGLLVRHLVLPGGLAGTREIMRFLANEISRNTLVNVMAQYRPTYRACEYPELTRRITRQEYESAVRAAREEGLRRFAG